MPIVGGSQPAAVELLVVLVRAIQSPINVQIGPRLPCTQVAVIARNDPRRNGVDKRSFTGREKQHLGTRPERGSQYDATALMAAHDGGRAYASTGGGATSKATAELSRRRDVSADQWGVLGASASSQQA